mmetsp:Transcript_17589/g.36515  ORF Transcript_17589/g.36515 Transcript_17589/m.36515 type:complete len:102 (+) Transcript_17589:548-853(+)
MCCTTRPISSSLSQFLQEHADEFLEGVVEFACKLALHRKSKVLEARDLQLHLEKNWNIVVPGYGDDPKPLRKQLLSNLHQSRMSTIGKAQAQAKADDGRKQ